MNLLLQSNPPKMLKLSKQTVLRFVRLHNILGKDLVYLSAWLYVGSVAILFVFFCIWYSQNLTMLSSVPICVGDVNYEVYWRILRLMSRQKRISLESFVCVHCLQRNHVVLIYPYSQHVFFACYILKVFFRIILF